MHVGQIQQSIILVLNVNNPRWTRSDQLEVLSRSLITLEENMWSETTTSLAEVSRIPALMTTLIGAIDSQIVGMRAHRALHPAAVCVACRTLAEGVAKVGLCPPPLFCFQDRLGLYTRH